MAGALLYTGPDMATLHAEYAAMGRVDEAAPLVSSSSIVVDAPVERVWAAISDFAGRAAWQPGFRLLEYTELRPGSTFRWAIGGTRLRSTFARVERERELSWTGRFLWVKAVDRTTLAPAGAGRTRVTVSESMAGPFLPLMYSERRLRSGHELMLAALKDFVETGGEAGRRTARRAN